MSICECSAVIVSMKPNKCSETIVVVTGVSHSPQLTRFSFYLVIMTVELLQTRDKKTQT